MDSSEEEEIATASLSTLKKLAKTLKGEDSAKEKRTSVRKVVPGPQRQQLMLFVPFLFMHCVFGSIKFCRR